MVFRFTSTSVEFRKAKLLDEQDTVTLTLEASRSSDGCNEHKRKLLFEITSPWIEILHSYPKLVDQIIQLLNKLLN